MTSATLDRFAARKTSVPRSTARADIALTICMARVGQIVSGLLQTVAFAFASCRIPSRVRAMAPPGQNPPLAVARQGKSVDCLSEGT